MQLHWLIYHIIDSFNFIFANVGAELFKLLIIHYICVHNSSSFVLHILCNYMEKSIGDDNTIFVILMM